MPELSVSGLKLFSRLAADLLKQVLDNLTAIAAMDGTNPNAISVLLVEPGTKDSIPLSEEQMDLMKHSLVFGVVPGPGGYWVTFFPQKIDEVALEPVTAREGQK